MPNTTLLTLQHLTDYNTELQTKLSSDKTELQEDILLEVGKGTNSLQKKNGGAIKSDDSALASLISFVSSKPQSLGESAVALGTGYIIELASSTNLTKPTVKINSINNLTLTCELNTISKTALSALLDSYKGDFESAVISFFINVGENYVLVKNNGTISSSGILGLTGTIELVADSSTDTSILSTLSGKFINKIIVCAAGGQESFTANAGSAPGKRSFAVNNATQALGDASAAFNSGSIAAGDYSVSFNSSRVFGPASIGGGAALIKENANGSIGVGVYCETDSPQSAVFGFKNIIGTNANQAFVTGANNASSFKRTFVTGQGNTATRDDQTIVGAFALPNENDYFVVGCGSSLSYPKTAFSVRADGIFGIGESYSSGTKSMTLTQLSTKSWVTNEALGIIGYGESSPSAKVGRVMLYNKPSETIQQIEASGSYAVSLGMGTISRGNASFSTNNQTNAIHDGSAAFGYKTTTTNNTQLVCGVGAGGSTTDAYFRVACSNKDGIAVLSNGNVNIGGSLNINSYAVISNNLTVSGNSNFTGDLDVGGDITVNSLSVYDDSVIVGDLNVGGTITTSGITTDNNLTVENNATIKNDLAVSGNSNITGNLDVGGTITTNSITTDNNLTVSGNSDITGDLVVDGNITTNSNLTVSGNSDIEGSLTTGNGLLVYGDSDVSGSLHVENGILTTTLTISANSDNLGDLYVDGVITARNDLVVSGYSDITGNLIVGGDITTNSNLTVENDATITNKLTAKTITSDSSIVSTNGGITSHGTIKSNTGKVIAGAALEGRELDVKSYARVGLNHTLVNKSGQNAVFGWENTLDTNCRHSLVIGANNYTNHDDTFIAGKVNNSSRNSQTVIGEYNKNDSEALFIIGNGSGSADDKRSNAFTVRANGDILGSVKTDISDSYGYTVTTTNATSFINNQLEIKETIDDQFLINNGKIFEEVSSTTINKGNINIYHFNGQSFDCGPEESSTLISPNTLKVSNTSWQFLHSDWDMNYYEHDGYFERFAELHPNYITYGIKEKETKEGHKVGNISKSKDLYFDSVLTATSLNEIGSETFALKAQNYLHDNYLSFGNGFKIVLFDEAETRRGNFDIGYGSASLSTYSTYSIPAEISLTATCNDTASGFDLSGSLELQHDSVRISVTDGRGYNGNMDSIKYGNLDITATDVTFNGTSLLRGVNSADEYDISLLF